MDMKINSQLVKKLREERAWSQEQLAQIAGISLRTIQRVERETGISEASNETRMALASAFGITVSELSMPEPEMPPKEKMCSMKRRWGTYLIACGFMFLIDFMHGGTIVWAQWPAIIWGSILMFRSFCGSRSA